MFSISALRVDPNSSMRAAPFSYSHVLHTLRHRYALRPEDNLAAASVEIVEASISSKHPIDHISHRCKIPAVVSEYASKPPNTPIHEHELLGDLLEAQAPRFLLAPPTFRSGPRQSGAASSAVATVFRKLPPAWTRHALMRS